jgi:hypothetical protein
MAVFTRICRHVRHLSGICGIWRLGTGPGTYKPSAAVYR